MYTLITLYIPAYTWKKHSAEYARILDVSDAVQSF